MADFVLFKKFTSLANGPLISEAFCKRWGELSKIPVKLQSNPTAGNLLESSCRGAVLPVCDGTTIQLLNSLSYPVINYSVRKEPVHFAVNVRYDSEEIGEIVADHLCEQGYKYFAFIHDSTSVFSFDRLAGFKNALARRGHQLDGILDFSQGEVLTWLSKFPKALGVLAANDGLGSSYYKYLHALDPSLLALQAIIGIDDDYPHWARIMPTSAVPLTSIHLNFEGVGVTCAELLHKALTSGEYENGSVHLVAGATLIRRQSSGGFSCDDPLVAQLARWATAAIEKGESPGMLELQQRFSVPRRILSERFRRYSGKSLREFIIQQRVQRAARLLLKSDSTVSEIAQQCGFNKHADLTERFGKYMGCSPKEYRANGKIR